MVNTEHARTKKKKRRASLRLVPGAVVERCAQPNDVMNGIEIGSDAYFTATHRCTMAAKFIISATGIFILFTFFTSLPSEES